MKVQPDTAARPAADRNRASAYALKLTWFLLSLGSLLLTMIEFRRGFLFGTYPVRTPWFSFHPAQLVLLALTAGSTGAAFRSVRLAEEREGRTERLARLTGATAWVIFLLLTVTLVFFYRGIPAARILAADRMSIGALGLDTTRLAGTQELVPVAGLPPAARPFAIAINYLSLVWGATILGILLSGLTLSAAPIIARRLLPAGTAGRLRTLLTGVAYGLPQPFCSCCAAPISATLYRATGSLTAAVAFMLTAPMLNVSTLILAGALLPPQYAALRVAGALAFVPLAALIVGRWGQHAPHVDRAPAPAGQRGILARALEGYRRLFDFAAPRDPAATPTRFVEAWLAQSRRVGRSVLPVLLAGAVAAGATATYAPGILTNDPAGVAAAALLGTLLMISTWTEIPVAGTLISQGLTGPAAALLLTLPAVSLPALMIIGGALRSARAPLLLGALTFALGVIAGVVAL